MLRSNYTIGTATCYSVFFPSLQRLLMAQTHCYCLKSQLFRYFYRPQRSCGQGYVFTRVCDSVNRGGSASVHAGIPPLPPGADTPPKQTPWEQTPPEADSGIRSMSGRYASYWNAFLFMKIGFVQPTDSVDFSFCSNLL